MADVDLVQRAYRKLLEDGPVSFFNSLSNYLSDQYISQSLYFKIYTTKNNYCNRFKFDSSPKPYSVIKVSPKEGERVACSIEKKKGLGQVRAGNWDKPENTKPLLEYPNYQGAKQRYQEGKCWEQTEYFKEAKRKIDNYGSYEGYTSTEEFLKMRCEYVDQLFQNILNEGYRPNYCGNHESPEQDKRAGTKEYIHELEPLVCIGRNGGIFWVEGLHRLAISRILEIEQIPVQVIVRHHQWQTLRDEVYNYGPSLMVSNELRTHPDLQDVI